MGMVARLSVQPYEASAALDWPIQLPCRSVEAGMQASTPGMSRRSRARRELLKMAPLAAAGLLLTERGRDGALRTGLALSDSAALATFRSDHLAPTFPDRDVTPLDRFPLNSYLVDDPEIDLDDWRLDVSGLVERTGEFTLGHLRRLPKIVQNTRHVCVEGWDVVGNFGGVSIAAFLHSVGAAAEARFLEVRCGPSSPAMW
jgi:DMSO/TMAO reductase YedYZ molybdopterin-dependent catalytic subunit